MLVIAAPSWPRSTAISSWRSYSSRPMKHPVGLVEPSSRHASFSGLPCPVHEGENLHLRSSHLFRWSPLWSSASRSHWALRHMRDAAQQPGSTLEAPKDLPIVPHCVEHVQAFRWCDEVSSSQHAFNWRLLMHFCDRQLQISLPGHSAGKCTGRIGLRSQNHV